MESTTKSVACVRQLRDAPLEEFRLPDDSPRQWRQVARNRQSLANFLATYADHDGSRVRPSVLTMCAHFGWSRATNFRLLKDLETLKLQKVVGRYGGSRGIAVRQIDVARFRSVQEHVIQSAFSSPKPVGVSGSELSESQTQVSESQAQVSESQAVLSESQAVSQPQPPRFTATVTATSTATDSKTEQQQVGGWRLLEEKHMAAIGYFGKKRSDFQRHIDDYGFDIVGNAVKAAIGEGNLDDAKSRPGIILHRLGQKLAAEVEKKRRAEQKAQDEINIEANIHRQIQEHIARNKARTQQAIAETSMSIEDFLE